LVPGDRCHYLEVATSIYRGEGPVKHYVESFFREYAPIAQGRGVLDDWATPLYSYFLAGAYRLNGVIPGQSLESTVAVAKATSFVLNLLCLPALYGFARRRFGSDVALGAMAALAILPVHALYAGFVLRESLVALSAILAVWTLSECWISQGRRAWGWAVVAGLFGGLAVLSRDTSFVLLGAAAVYGLVVRGRTHIGPLVLWGIVLSIVIAPWAWATYQVYGQPFYSYTQYFQYNFSWTVHHFDRGNTRASDFYTHANMPAIIRVKIKSLLMIATYSTMIVGLPLVLGFLHRVVRPPAQRPAREREIDNLALALGLAFIAATLVRVADITQVAQLGRYYLPLFALGVPTAVAGLRDAFARWGVAAGGRVAFGATLAAVLWADPTWAYDASWLVKPYQLHWPALRAAGDWIRAHPEAVPPDARIMTWFPWELRVASDRTTILFPRSLEAGPYELKRVDETIRTYRATHVLWGSFEPSPHSDPESLGPYLERLRVALGLTDHREIYRSPARTRFPVRLFRLGSRAP
jgi:4-amino-4-deoxy-L-arabinose transferase-like glycosyltransferase